MHANHGKMNVRFQVLKAVCMNMSVFWVVPPDYTTQQPRRQPSSRIYVSSETLHVVVVFHHEITFFLPWSISGLAVRLFVL
jgi:hypothetical protein